MFRLRPKPRVIMGSITARINRIGVNMFASTGTYPGISTDSAKITGRRSTRVGYKDVGVWTGRKNCRSACFRRDVGSNGCDFYAVLPADILSGGFERLTPA